MEIKGHTVGRSEVCIRPPASGILTVFTCHQRLVESVVNDAKKDGTIPSLITFDPDPWVVLRGMHDPAHLTTMEDRARIARQMGIECFLILDFTEAMLRWTPHSFMRCWQSWG
ncbi:MAG: hypothetical protein ACLVJ6_06415 [Merdibacter sp.]